MTGTKFEPILHRVLQGVSSLQVREVRRFQAERFVFTIQVKQQRHKVFQVLFQRDGSIYATFPYFDIKEGIVSIGTLSILSNITKVNLEHKGKVTARRVKYSHHPSGEVHFSQAGSERVKTEIRKNALPLAISEGHLFSISIQGFDHFQIDSVTSDHIPTRRRTVLNFSFEQNSISAAKFVARWHHENSLLNRSPNKNIGPKSTGITPDGKRVPNFFVGSLMGWPLSDHVLAISCEAIDILDKDQDAVLNFIGGFDTPDTGIAHLPTFLCVNYPVSNYDVLEKQIGSIDIFETNINKDIKG